MLLVTSALRWLRVALDTHFLRTWHGARTVAIDLLFRRSKNVNMPKMNFNPVSLSDTFDGENTVWTQLQSALGELDGDTFYRLPILNGDDRFMYEPDIVVALRGRMPVVIECKGCRLSDIVSIHGAVWTMGDTWYRAREKPLNQARDQAIALGEMLRLRGAPSAQVHSLVVLPFIGRAGWEARFGSGLAISAGILFADDITLPECFATRILKVVSTSAIDPGPWNRLATVLGARDRWTEAPAPSAPMRPPVPRAPVRPSSVPSEGQAAVGPGVTIVHYAGRPPTVDEICRTVGIDTSTPHTYLVATAALERKRRQEGLGGSHQLKKDLRDEATEPEEMQLLFHKALRHFIARPMITRTEERVLIQRAIRALAEGDRVVAEQLRRDVFAWRDVLAEIEEEGVDLAVDGAGMQWAHPDLERIAKSLQGIYRKLRHTSNSTKPTFEEAARRYLETGYVPTPIVVMEGFTRLTPLQQAFIRRCADEQGMRLCLVLPHNPDQQTGFAALDRTYTPFQNLATHIVLDTPALGEHASLAHLQSALFSHSAVSTAIVDDGVSICAFSHRNDEVASCVREVIRLVYDDKTLRSSDLVIVCSDPQGIMPLLRDEAELCGVPDLFALPPRQLLLTPVGRFILVLYDVWEAGTLHMEPEQLATLLASGWLGSHAQKGAELFVAVSHQCFTYCRSAPEWRAAFDLIERQLGEGDTVLGKLSDRLPASMLVADDLATWRSALDVIIQLCERVFAAGERPIGKHISLLLDEIEMLDPLGMLKTEREVLADIRTALAEIADSRSVAIDAEEFGEVLSGLIHERQDDQDGDIPGSRPGARSQQVWVVGPEGVDNIERHTVFFLGVDDQRMPAPGGPPWPRTDWSAQEHIERQRYRFLAVVRAAQHRLLMSYARQDWQKHYQPSPYLDEAAYLLRCTIRAQARPMRPARAPVQPTRAHVPMRRERYTVSELATYGLCPYRFKMEALTRWAGRYTQPWQLEWLARGVWLAEVFHHVATQYPGPHTADEFEQVLVAAVDAVRPRVEARLPGLRRLAWTGAERQVRGTVNFLLAPSTHQQLPLLGMAIPRPRGKARPISIGERDVRIAAEADFLEQRGSYMNFVRDTNQTAQWLIFGKDEQALSDGTDEEDPHQFRTLRQAVDWWRDLTFSVTKKTKSLEPEIINELSHRIQSLERGNFKDKPGDHCRYCPVADTCMALRP